MSSQPDPKQEPVADPIADPIDSPIDDPIDVTAALAELGLTEAELDAALEAGGPDLGLAAVWEPDDQMLARVTSKVENRLADREALKALAELGGLGWFTLKAVFGDQN